MHVLIRQIVEFCLWGFMQINNSSFITCCQNNHASLRVHQGCCYDSLPFCLIPLLVFFLLSFAFQSLLSIRGLVSNVAVAFGLFSLNIFFHHRHMAHLFLPRIIDAQHLFGLLNVL
ncbi:uncharacterized protein DS421_13g419890 [Arachis hypogaea]|nr:uncharacterized protein DS421_13g419890 [Arachis hypogaea]